MFEVPSNGVLRALGRLFGIGLPSAAPACRLPSQLRLDAEVSEASKRESVKQAGDVYLAAVELGHSEEMLRLVLETAGLGMWRWEVADPAAPLIWDARCKALFGLPPDATASYMTWLEAVHPGDRLEVLSAIASALDPSIPDDSLACKYRIMRPSGGVLWVMVTGRACFEPDAAHPSGRRARRFLGTVRDVTDMELADQSRLSREKRSRYFLSLEERLRSAVTARDAVSRACEAIGQELQASIAGVGELQADGLYTVVESAWSATGDLSPLIGTHRFMSASQIEGLLQAGVFVVEDIERDSRLNADPGARAAYQAFGVRSAVSVPLLRDGRPRAFLFIGDAMPRAWTEAEIALGRETFERAWQTVERARAEEELRQTNERFELALKGSPVAVYCQDLELRYTWIYNPASGRAPSEMIGKLDTDIFERPEDAAATEAIKREVIRTGAPRRQEVLIHSKEGDRNYDLLAVPLLDASGHIKGVRCAAIDITERKHEQQHIRLLLHEVNHRSKNMLMLVQAVARQTAAQQTGDFLHRFDERLRALASSQDVVVRNEWRGAGLAELISSQLSHFKDLIGTRIALEGPPIFISASAAQTIGMAVHELATNAGKYGALSNDNGRIDVGWSLQRQDGGQQAFVMTWDESGGPPVSPPAHRGFGSTLISDIVEASLNAEVELGYPSQGLFWRLACPAEEVFDTVESV